MKGNLIFNQLINFFWTVLCFSGIIVYWFDSPSVKPLAPYILISLVSAVVPSKYYQLSRRPKFYERLGVRKIRFFVQDGNWRRLITKNKPAASKLIGSRSQAANYLKTVVIYERYHLICLVFFLLCGFHAFAQHRIGLAIIITLSNVVYNVCPMLLQQYNRARIEGIR
ncbi:MAG: hypothetical protein ABUL46_01490 [Chitinophaga rupis]